MEQYNRDPLMEFSGFWLFISWLGGWGAEVPLSFAGVLRAFGALFRNDTLFSTFF